MSKFVAFSLIRLASLQWQVQACAVVCSALRLGSMKAMLRGQLMSGNRFYLHMPCGAWRKLHGRATQDNAGNRCGRCATSSGEKALQDGLIVVR